MTIAEKLQTIAENEQKVYDAGRQAEYDAFWDQYQKNGKQNNYLYAFSGIAWTDETYNPKYTIKPTTNASGMFLYSNVTDTKVTIDISESKQNVVSMFANSQIKTIPLLIVSETTPSLGTTNSSPFQSCSKLENITIQGTLAKNAYFRWCPLTRESIENIISVLSDEAVGMTVDFKKSAVDTAFETSEGAADGSNSEAWLSLVTTKSNWTISLV